VVEDLVEHASADPGASGMIGGTVPVAAIHVQLTPLLDAAGSTAFIYLFLVTGLRLVGRRQLGQLTVIDLIVVLVLGSAVETAMIHGNTSLLVGLVSAATLLIVNRLLTLVLRRSPRLRHLVNGGPILLVNHGRVVHEHLVRVGLTEADLEEALRSRGYAGTAGVRAAVLETDGTVSVIGDRPAG
jgi:uncharacterized membrane protein YcaP (DUF421 family)